MRSANTSDSLAAEFVKFLQNESRPRAPLPNMMTLGQGSSSRSATPSSRKNSTIGEGSRMDVIFVFNFLFVIKLLEFVLS